MKKVIIFCVIVLLFLISGCQTGQIIEEKILQQNTVERVIDGDTFVLATGEHVRLLHINTPEKDEFCYQEAKEKLAELVLNKTIWLERDMQSTDKYNRSLRYIYLSNNSDKSINEVMVEEGFAVAYILLPNTRYKNAFFKAEENAIESKAGCLWKNKSESCDCLQIIELKTCKEGDYIVLKNNCNDLNLDGWALRDQSRSYYSLSGIIKEGTAIKITRDGWETTHECIWSDYSNTLYIFDNNDGLVLRYYYA
jgi:endonuclease YncB( thermonuclease family)